MPQVQRPIPPSQNSPASAQNPPRETLASAIGAKYQEVPHRDPHPTPPAANPVPAGQPRAAATDQRPAPTPAPRTLDANSCTATELLALPGMNAAVARAIVSEREQNGPYQSLEDLVARNDLKPHVVAAFIASISVSAPSAVQPGSQHVRMLDL